MKLKLISTLIGMLLVLPGCAAAGDAVLYEYDGSFDDATFETREAIIAQGLTIEYVSHVGEMLARTKEDVGGTKDLFANGEIYVFCSASISRKAMEADLMNIAHCPYNVFVFETIGEDSKVYVGHRDLPDGSMQPVEDMLEAIAKEATGQ